MEQPCYKCGQAVEEGVPFCPNCSAPQIRVMVAAPLQVPAGFPDTATTSQGAAAIPPSQAVPVLGLSMHWSQAVRPCALAALVASLLMLLGLNTLVAALSVGFLAVVFYRYRQPGAIMKAAAGARLGALSGLLWFCFVMLLGALAATVPDARTKMREQFVENFQKVAASRPPDPQIKALVEQLKTPEGLVMILIVFGVLLFVFSIVLATLGGTVAGAIMSRRDRS